LLVSGLKGGHCRELTIDLLSEIRFGEERRELESDRFSLKQKESRFFEKKRRKKLLLVWACGAETSTAQSKEVFLLLFVHKKKPSSSLKHDPS
jgi:hypothetical protein